MRTIWTSVTMAAMLLGISAVSLGEDAKAPAQVAPPANQTTGAQLRAQLHRAMAELIEARAAKEPDQARIDQLSRQVAGLRQQIAGQPPAPGAGAFCPWGGPGLNLGFGRGPAWGGRGPGYGRGMGYGGGFGRGPGYGRGAGWGAANGFPGRAFVDRDGDGVCDNFELRQNPQ